MFKFHSFLPRTQTRGVKQLVLSVIVCRNNKNRQIWRLGVWVTCTVSTTRSSAGTTYPLKLSRNLAHYVSNHLARPMSLANTLFCWPHLWTPPTTDHVLSANVHNLAQCVGTRQRSSTVSCVLSACNMLAWSSLTLQQRYMQHAWGMCSIEL